MSRTTFEPSVELSPEVSDEIRQTTCYMCACRCGINVHLKDGKIRYIEGNRDHPVNKGVLCAKGAAGIMQQYAPSKLRTPLLRVGERGEGKYKEISWEDALEKAVAWLAMARARDPKKLAFFTGRDQSQSLTSWWAQQFGTPNYAAHGGFCSVNMAAAGIYTMGGSFWEFGQPDWERTKMFMLFGVAEDHDSNPIKTGLSRLKERGAKIVGVNPVRTGYNAIADEWVPVTPGTDGLFILSLVHELLNAGQVDLDYLLRYTNAGWLVIDAPEDADHGLFARDEKGDPLSFDRKNRVLAPAKSVGKNASLKGSVVLSDGRTARPVFELLAEKYSAFEFAPQATSSQTGVPADQTIRLAKELARTAFEEEIIINQPWTDMTGEKHDVMIGRPVSFHAMRGISAHANGFQTCRALHLLQILLGSIECPGGFRFKPPYPKPSDAHPVPNAECSPNSALAGPHLGYPQGPEDLLVEEDGAPKRIDKAFSWEHPLSVHGMMHMVISNAYHGDPYPIDVLFMYMANMSWNSSMNTAGTMDMLTAKNGDGSYVIPKIIYSDAYSSEMVAYADLILPDTTYLERHDCISMLDRPISEAGAAADAIRWPVLEPDRDVRGFQSVLLDLGARLGLAGMVDEHGDPKYEDYADYITNHERKPGIGPLAGFRGEHGHEFGRGSVNAFQLDRYIANGGYWQTPIPENAQYFKHANQDYQNWAVSMGFYDDPKPVVFQLYLETLAKFQRAAEGHGDNVPPDYLKTQYLKTFDPLPIWYATDQDGKSAGEKEEEYPYHAVTQRPAAMYHSWGSQNAWLRQIHGTNPMYVPIEICRENGLEDGDWAWIISEHGRIKVPVKSMAAVNNKTLWTWNAIGKRKGTWALDENADETEKGFLLNHLINELLPLKEDGKRHSNSDPITGQGAWFDLKVRIEKAETGNEGIEPIFDPLGSPVPPAKNELAYGKEWTK